MSGTAGGGACSQLGEGQEEVGTEGGRGEVEGEIFRVVQSLNNNCTILLSHIATLNTCIYISMLMATRSLHINYYYEICNSSVDSSVCLSGFSTGVICGGQSSI